MRATLAGHRLKVMGTGIRTKIVAAIAAIAATAALMLTACIADKSENPPPDAAPSGDGAPNAHYVSTFLTSPLVQREDGSPNPRIACTDGNKFARDYLAAELTNLGLAPGGDTGAADVSFLNLVPGSIDPDYCPHGIANVVGVVRGRSLPNEYVTWVAHYDGPNNEGISRQQGVGATSNVYDNAAAVAVGLELAAYFKQNPAERSVVVFFSDAEEGWENVGLRPPDATGPNIDCSDSKTVPAFAETGCAFEDGFYPIGFSSWLAQPTLPLEELKLVVVADPLGASGVEGSNFLAIIGTDESAGLNPLTKTVFPPGPGEVQNIYFDSKSVTGFLSDAMAVSRFYDNNCGASGQAPCLRAGGIPYVWLSQGGMQRYHAGHGRDLLAASVQGDGLTLAPQFWSLDTVQTFDHAAFAPLYEHLRSAFAALASVPELSQVTYHGSSELSSATVIEDARDSAHAVIDALDKGPAITGITEGVTPFLRLVGEAVVTAADAALANLDSNGSAPFDQGGTLVALFLMIDIFAEKETSNRYPPPASPSTLNGALAR